MATNAQVLANRANAQHSTGPKSEAGKAAASQNAASHGLSSSSFALLPHENTEEFTQLLHSLTGEYEPDGPSEEFLVTEMARAQWKLRRIDAIEAAILTGAAAATEGDPWTAIAGQFQSPAADALLKLDRYAASARRAWHKAFDLLVKFRAASDTSGLRQSRIERNLSEAAINRVIAAPVAAALPPIPLPTANYRTNPISAANCRTTPMPAHLEREMRAHERRDPLFDPRRDASQMSKELRKWFAAA
jgi:hypothetical protein